MGGGLPAPRPDPHETDPQSVLSRTKILPTAMMPTFALAYFALRLTSNLILANSYTSWIGQSLIDFDYLFYWHGMIFHIKFFFAPEMLLAGPTLGPSSVAGWQPLQIEKDVKSRYIWRIFERLMQYIHFYVHITSRGPKTLYIRKIERDVRSTDVNASVHLYSGSCIGDIARKWKEKCYWTMVLFCTDA